MLDPSAAQFVLEVESQFDMCHILILNLDFINRIIQWAWWLLKSSESLLSVSRRDFQQNESSKRKMEVLKKWSAACEARSISQLNILQKFNIIEKSNLKFNSNRATIRT